MASKISITKSHLPPIIVTTPTPPEVPPVEKVVDPARRLTNHESVDVLALLGVVTGKVKDLQLDHKLKAEMIAGRAKFADGPELGVAQLKVSEAGRQIDPIRFFQACKAAKLSLEQTLGAMSVSFTAAEELLSGSAIASITVPTPPRAPALEVKPRKGVPVPGVTEALLKLMEYFAGDDSDGPEGGGSKPDPVIDTPPAKPATAGKGKIDHPAPFVDPGQHGQLHA